MRRIMRRRDHHEVSFEDMIMDVKHIWMIFLDFSFGFGFLAWNQTSPPNSSSYLCCVYITQECVEGFCESNQSPAEWMVCHEDGKIRSHFSGPIFPLTAMFDGWRRVRCWILASASTSDAADATDTTTDKWCVEGNLWIDSLIEDFSWRW